MGDLDIYAQTGLSNPAQIFPGKNRTASLLNKSSRVRMTLGDPSEGETLGLDGVLFGVGSETEGYNRWDLILTNADKSKFANDMSLQLALEIRMQQFRLKVIVPIEVKAGNLQSRTSFLVPFNESSPLFNWWNRMLEVHVQISQNGFELRGLFAKDTNRFSTAAQWNYDSRSNTQSLLLVSDSLLKNRTSAEWSDSATVVTANNSQMGITAESIIGFDWAQLVASDEWIHPNYGLAIVDRLPSNWLEFAAREKIVMSVKDFPSLNADQRDAILDYALAGGEFIITDLSTDSDLEGDVKGWIDSLVSTNGLPLQLTSMLQQATEKREGVSIPVGFGKVVLWNSPLHSFQNNIFSPMDSRAKISMTHRGASDTMDWYIPRVGQPPVIGFSLLICAFALIAGPLLLWWANNRLKRPVLVLIVFPPFAILFTSLILCYSVLKDGFETYARVRSISWVNQPDSRGIAYSRQTYFSGMPPMNLAFSSRSEVLPTYSPTNKRGQRSDSENILLQWRDDLQIYSGFLKPRFQSQWTVTTPMRTIKTFDYVVNPQSSKLTKIQNLMEDDWKLAIICDKNSNLTRVGETRAGEQGTVSEISEIDALSEVKALYKPLAYPPGYSGTEGSVGGWLTSDYSDRPYESSDPYAGIESKLINWTSREGMLVPGSFIIFLSSASYLDQPLRDDVRESDSFHVLAGRW